VFDNDDYPPDAEFGCFQVVKGPPDSNFANEALLRLDVGKLCCYHSQQSQQAPVSPCKGIIKL